MATNRGKWDESVRHHVTAPLYDVEGFLRGRSSLEAIEPGEMGPVRGRSLVHLQCHIGLDTLSWARRGAVVTGVDFSLPAVRVARRLARRAGLTARFVRSNVYDVPRTVRETFDIVYTGKGAICWLPDIDGWAKVVAGLLSPGGRLYVLDDHPFVEVFPNEAGTRALNVRLPYFREGAVREVYDGTYATSAKMRHRVTYSWVHRVGRVLGALADAGLIVRSVREYPFTYWRRFPFMHRDRSGAWRLDRDEGIVPLMWSVTAVRPPPAAAESPR